MKRLLYFGLILIFGCTSGQTEYTTIINYDPIGNIKYMIEENPCQEYNIYVHFDGGFEDDEITIRYGQTKTQIDSVTTDESTGYATHVIIPLFGVPEVSVSKSNGPILKIDVSKSQSNIWSIYFYHDTLVAQALKRLPIYM